MAPRSVFLASFLLFSSLAARADAIVYDVTGGGILSGTVSIDSTVGTITTSDLTVTTPNFTDILTSGGGTRSGRTGYELTYATVHDAYQLLLTSPNSDGTLKGFTGGKFTFTDARNIADATGTLVATAPSPATITPEPGSLWLLGTGALGLAAPLRRRWAARVVCAA